MQVRSPQAQSRHKNTCKLRACHQSGRPIKVQRPSSKSVHSSAATWMLSKSKSRQRKLSSRRAPEVQEGLWVDPSIHHAWLHKISVEASPHKCVSDPFEVLVRASLQVQEPHQISKIKVGWGLKSMECK